MSKKSFANVNNVISVKGARQNNLKGIDVDIPLGELTVVTGPSGSGKSSLAFQTLYAEGQRRYVETFSPYIRQFFDRMDKPVVDRIDGIPPAIAIEQTNNVRSTRSTVGTITEINDYLKLLFARLAKGYCPKTGIQVKPETPQSILKFALNDWLNQNLLITFPIPAPTGTDTAEFFQFLQQQGFTRVLIYGQIYRTDEPDTYQRPLPAEILVIQDRIKSTKTNQARLSEAIETALHLGKGTVVLCTTDPQPVAGASSPQAKPNRGGGILPPSQSPQAKVTTKSFSADWLCPESGIRLRPPTPGLFSFNSPIGACPSCRGFGKIIALDLRKAIPDESLTLRQGAIKAFQGDTYSECQRDLIRCAKRANIDINTPFEDLSEDQQEWVTQGDPSFDTADEAWEHKGWYGIRGFFDWLETKSYKMHVRVFLSRFRDYTTCPACRGSRLQPEALNFRIAGKTLADIWKLPVENLLPFFENDAAPLLPKDDHATALVFKSVVSRLHYLTSVGLNYLTLDRETRTLSGGETARVNLTTCLGAHLTGTLFVLDEPSVGLHPRDTGRLINILHRLRDQGNTIVVVEHEESIMRAADNIIDIGPGRGRQGGELIYSGPTFNLLNNGASAPGTLSPSSASIPPSQSDASRNLITDNKELTTPSLTAAYLTGTISLPVPKNRRKPTHHLRLCEATGHNIRKLDIDIPLGIFTAISGVSGSGKSTLIHHILYPHLLQALGKPIKGEHGKLKLLTGAEHITDVVLVDQTPIARTPRSTPVVYLGVFDSIRKLLTQTPDAKADDLKPGYFSFNSPGGRCERCSGMGWEKIEMQFLSDLFVICPECEGSRYTRAALEYKLHGKSVADILNLTTDEAHEFFSTWHDRLGDAESGHSHHPGNAALPPPSQTAPPSSPSAKNTTQTTVAVASSRQAKSTRAVAGASSPSAKPLPIDIQRIVSALDLLRELGLGYLRLGQPVNTLSGGEAQRLKLISHLLAQPTTSQSDVKKPTTNNQQPISAGTVFIFDEPTTGLHFDDIRLLLAAFQRLVNAGNSIIVIEHNLDVLKTADHIIDLGPEAGQHGGQLVARGTPEQLATMASAIPATAGHTAHHLASHLSCGAFQAPSQTQKVAEDPSHYLTHLANPTSSTHGNWAIPNPPTNTASNPPRTGNAIHIHGAREHNLKNIDLVIPRDEFVVITGLSGSGKSTIAFDIIFAEGQRRFLDSMSPYARQFAEQLEKPDVDHIEGLPPTVAIEQRISRGGGKSTIGTVTEVYHFLRLLFAKVGIQHCPESGVPVVSQSQTAIAEQIRKLAKTSELRILAPVIRNRKGFHTDVAEAAGRKGFTELYVNGQLKPIEGFQRLERFKQHDIDIVTAIIPKGSIPAPKLDAAIATSLTLGKGSLRVLPSSRLTTSPSRSDASQKLISDNQQLITLSTKAVSPVTGQSFDELEPNTFSFNSPRGYCPECRGFGFIHSYTTATGREESVLEAELNEERRLENADESELITCPACRGTRLHPAARAVKVLNHTIGDLVAQQVTTLAETISKLKFTGREKTIARDILPEITQRLHFMDSVGLGYLTLDRAATTLSGGEAQRIRLAAQLGSNLRGVLYVLDEPTIGLHPRDNKHLLDTLEKLRAKGNSLLIVEHDEETMQRASHILDLGPGAGRLGGEVVASGTLAQLKKADKRKSATARHLSAPLIHPMRGQRRKIPAKTATKVAEASTPNRGGGDLSREAKPFYAILPPSQSPTVAGASSPQAKQTATNPHSNRAIYKQSSKTASNPSERAPLPAWLTITRAHLRNLKSIDIRIPVQRLTVLTGVSGSGKSTFMRGVLKPVATAHTDKKTKPKPATYRHLCKSATGFHSLEHVYEVDQSPIGKTSRSTPSTYVKVFDEIRALFASVPDARMRGYTASRFSFNTEGGRCETCKGNGRIKLEMNFLPTTWVPCEECDGKRYNPATLEVEYNNKNIGDVMAMTISEAAEFFTAHSKIHRTLQLMADTGLGYLQLGQPSPTLSGGEAQRIKLVAQLTRGIGRTNTAKLKSRSAPHCLYLIEEPTIGLHMEDVAKLIDVLHRLVDDGHTVVVIEHNTSVMAEADYLIDIGPEAGDCGGKVVAQGTPEQVAKSKTSKTAPFVKAALGL